MLGRLEGWLGGRSGFEIVGKAYSGRDAITQSGALRPDLVVMDVTMPMGMRRRLG
jgi:YesN/AraC family two-component response regulator